MIAAFVYTLCAITCIACAALLWRGYLRGRATLLLWSTLCFVGLTVNNVLLVVDQVIYPTTIDLYMVRLVSTVVALGLLVFGLIWPTDR